MQCRRCEVKFESELHKHRHRRLVRAEPIPAVHQEEGSRHTSKLAWARRTLSIGSVVGVAGTVCYIFPITAGLIFLALVAIVALLVWVCVYAQNNTLFI